MNDVHFAVRLVNKYEFFKKKNFPPPSSFQTFFWNLSSSPSVVVLVDHVSRATMLRTVEMSCTVPSGTKVQNYSICVWCGSDQSLFIKRASHFCPVGLLFYTRVFDILHLRTIPHPVYPISFCHRLHASIYLRNFFLKIVFKNISKAVADLRFFYLFFLSKHNI